MTENPRYMVVVLVVAVIAAFNSATWLVRCESVREISKDTTVGTGDDAPRQDDPTTAIPARISRKNGVGGSERLSHDVHNHVRLLKTNNVACDYGF